MRYNNRIINVIIILIIVILFTRCGPTEDPSKDIVFPSSKVSYAQHVQPLFNYRCAFSGCHDDDMQNTRLSLTSYYNIVYKYPGIVVPGAPDNSILIQKLKGIPPPRMPLLKDTLSLNHFNGLKTWIKEGALNN